MQDQHVQQVQLTRPVVAFFCTSCCTVCSITCGGGGGGGEVTERKWRESVLCLVDEHTSTNASKAASELYFY